MTGPARPDLDAIKGRIESGNWFRSGGVSLSEAAALVAWVEALEAELSHQWEAAHAEHCGHAPGYMGTCHWPRPALLPPPAPR